MKSRDGSPARNKKQRPSKSKGDITHYYLTEILRNIEDLQTTILKKLDNPQQSRPHHKHASHMQTPLSIKSNKQASLSKSPKTTAYHTQRCYTTREQPSTPKKTKTQFETTPVPVPQPQPLMAINTPSTTITLNFNTLKQKTQSACSGGKARRITDTLPKGKENQHSVKTQKDEPTHRYQLSRRKYDIQLVDQPPPASPQAPQEFYRREIERLQVQGRIRQLEQELEECLYNKRASKPAEFSFLRAKMRKISLELVQLREQRDALRQ